MHIPVLLGEAVGALSISKGDIIVDATLGDGGHSKEILKKLRNGILIAIDIDQEAISGCGEELEKIAKKNFNKIFFVQDNFANLDKILKKQGISSVNGILADLGWRSDQIEERKYGLSFQVDGPLNMKLGQMNDGENAGDIINKYREKELADIFKKYGEERFASRVARAIIEERGKRAIATTEELAMIIKKSIGAFYRKSKIHPATKIFQALRIAVNGELDNLINFLPKAVNMLAKGGRLAIISFHSLEDREVKKFFQANTRGCICPKGAPICFCGRESKIKKITKKPIIPSEREVEINFRSRSAKLRVAERT